MYLLFFYDAPILAIQALKFLDLGLIVTSQICQLPLMHTWCYLNLSSCLYLNKQRIMAYSHAGRSQWAISWLQSIYHGFMHLLYVLLSFLWLLKLQLQEFNFLLDDRFLLFKLYLFTTNLHPFITDIHYTSFRMSSISDSCLDLSKNTMD